MTEIENKLATWFFSLIGYFNHYSFFTEKLWQQIPKFGGEDEANVKCAFMHWWFHNNFGYFTTPVGMTWFHETTEELYNDYIKQYRPLFKAYEKWVEKQR